MNVSSQPLEGLGYGCWVDDQLAATGRAGLQLKSSAVGREAELGGKSRAKFPGIFLPVRSNK